MKAGDTVEVKPKPGLGGWVRGVLVELRRDTAIVTIRDATLEIARRHVRAPALKRRPPPPSLPPLPRLERVPVKRPPELRPQPKSLPVRDASYLAFIRAKPCMFCAAPPPSDPDHVGPHGIGTKADDLRTVPVCRRHHDERHARGAVAPFDVEQTMRAILERQVTLLIEFMTRKEADDDER